MRKVKWIGLIILLSMLASACAQQTTAPATETAAVEPTEVEVTQVSMEEVGDTSGAAQCKPYNLLNEILPPPDPNLAPLTEDDNAKGPADAKITILEFSDFQ